MATTEIAWNDGSNDKIYVTSNAFEGDQTVLVSSDANTGVARTKTVTFTAGSITKNLTISQPAAAITVPYIRNTNVSRYIDTGITPDDSIKVIIWARNFNPGKRGNTILFGTRTSNQNDCFYFYTGLGTSYGRVGLLWADNSVVYAANCWKYFGGYHKYEYSSSGLYIDDVRVAQVSATTLASNYSIHLFGINDGGGHSSSNMPVDICACKIYKNNTLVRDFTPVNSPTVGFYDAVSDTVFGGNDSDGLEYRTFDLNAYTRLEYISCSGQYFDTGIYGTYASEILCYFRNTGTTARYSDLLGTVDTSSVNSCCFGFGTDTSVNLRMYWRCGPTTSTLQLYNSVSPRLTNLDIVATKQPNSATALLYRNNATVGSSKTSTATSGYTTPRTLYVGGANGYNPSGRYFIGRIYFLNFQTERNFVPAKVNGIAGMYDTYHDTFYRSISGTDFTAGPEL